MNGTYRILVVDDISSMRRLVSAFLHELGYRQIAQAASGAEAFMMLQKQTFDLLITDWSMPGMTGLELLRAVRTTSDKKELPVLLITAEARKENILSAAQSGANGYVVKPFSITTLGEKVERILRRSQDDTTTVDTP